MQRCKWEIDSGIDEHEIALLNGGWLWGWPLGGPAAEELNGHLIDFLEELLLLQYVFTAARPRHTKKS